MTNWWKKKALLFISMVAFLVSVDGLAQNDSIYVYRSAAFLYKQSVDRIDSLTFAKKDSKTVLNLHYRRAVVFEKNVSEIDSVRFGSNMQPPLLPLSGNNWMTRIAGNTYLRNVSIPGTHDSGALQGDALWSKCQDWNISTQLNKGIRFFDIRFKVKDGRLKIYHSIVDMDIYHDDLFETIIRFLSDNPSEAVIVSIKNENDGAGASEKAEFVQILDAHINANSSRWFTGSSVPLMSEARGKMVLFRRYGGSSKGIDLSSWPDNTVFSVGGGSVQDVYKGGTSDAKVNEKWGYISALLNEAYDDYATKGGNHFYVNFCSASATFVKPKAIADKINPKLQAFMNSAGKGSWGWILMDFPTEELVETIYMKNIQ